jgi:hypothetical protein
VGRTLHNILLEVLLCIAVAMGLTISCLPMGTCCQHYAMFVSITVVVFSGAEVAVAVEALALRVHALANKGLQLLVAALLELLFIVQSVVA